ncbi:MAG: hypothetical protein ACRCR6_08255 [Plesiomonas sp.]
MIKKTAFILSRGGWEWYNKESGVSQGMQAPPEGYGDRFTRMLSSGEASEALWLKTIPKTCA